MQSYASDNRKAKTAKTVAASQSKGGGVVGFLLLTLISLGVCAVAIFSAGGPVTSSYFDDWAAWARIETLASGTVLLFFFCALIGIIGMFARLFSPRQAQTLPATRVMSGTLKPAPATKPSRLSLDERAADEPMPMVASSTAANLTSHAVADDLSIPALSTASASAEVADNVQSFAQPASTSATVKPLRTDSRKPSLKFDLSSIGTPQDAPETVDETAVEALAVTETAPEVVTEAAPVDIQRHSAEIIPLRPQVVPQTAAVAAVEAEHATAIDSLALEAQALETQSVETQAVEIQPIEDLTVDPIASALLADAPEPATKVVAESDINAVITSAMRFIDSPAPQVEVTHEALHRAMTEDDALHAPSLRISETTSVPEPSSWTIIGRDEIKTDIAPSTETLIKASAPIETPFEAPVEVAAPAPVITESRLDQAVEKALALWPQTTRPIAADELKVRAGFLYNHETPEVRAVFDLLAEGNVDLAASCLQTLANARAFAGHSLEAAELWRAYGALHMGRDDPKAMMAYEQVSALDPSDANIHLYLTRRYAMEDKTELMLPTLSRALMVISDPYTRIELLGHYGDLAMKAGMLDASAQAFGELSQLQETQGLQNPDNLQMRSAHAISVAKLAQVRELQGQLPTAAPLYRKAHQLLAELSARVPDHAGLRAMTANALKDATRLQA